MDSKRREIIITAQEETIRIFDEITDRLFKRIAPDTAEGCSALWQVAAILTQTVVLDLNINDNSVAIDALTNSFSLK